MPILRRLTVPMALGTVAAATVLSLDVGRAAGLDVRVDAPLQVIVVDDVETETPPTTGSP